MKVLVTGGAGYVGSHTVVALIEAGFTPVVVDNLANSSGTVFERIKTITGHSVQFHEADVRQTAEVKKIVRDEKIRNVIHFAALKSVEESIRFPLRYYENNLESLFSVLDAIDCDSDHAKSKLIFSSSATVYGSGELMPISEVAPTGKGITNPYGQSKHFGEQVLRDISKSNSSFSAIALRYFNPIGAHFSGIIGENTFENPSNVAPLIMQVAAGRRSHLDIFGNDYPTPDGTGVRDYVHVMDIAEGHVAALRSSVIGFNAFNLGTGNGTSVFELISIFESVSGIKIPYEIMPRRDGDIAESFADVTLAIKKLSWRSSRSVSEACRDMWNWLQANPDGF
jgi:UDP-glucose 4-epimerase